MHKNKNLYESGDAETVWDVVKAFVVGKPDSLVTVIPKALREQYGHEVGTKFLVKTDEKGRIILERISR